ncbi:MAG: extracellular solute-binding protein [Nocardioidaceae bacterium]
MSFVEVLMAWGRMVLAVVAASVVLAVAGCGAGASGSGSGQAPLTLYNGQHESTTKLLVHDFTKATGIKVRVKNGDDGQLANEILQEGSASPADVFYTENSPALMHLSDKGELASTKPATRDNIPARYDSPRHDWMGVAGRETVLVYNPDEISKSQLPDSLLDLGKSSWHHTVGIQPSRPDFQAIVGGVAAIEGNRKTEQWLEGLDTHDAEFNHAEGILQAVHRGQIPVGIIYTYDWFRNRAESPTSTAHTKLYYFGHDNPGALMNVSGVGVLKSSEHKVEARRLLAFLTGKKGQQALAHSDDFEYPLNPKVSANSQLKPRGELQRPNLTPGQIGDGTQAVTLLRQAGML